MTEDENEVSAAESIPSLHESSESRDSKYSRLVAAYSSNSLPKSNRKKYRRFGVVARGAARLNRIAKLQNSTRIPNGSLPKNPLPTWNDVTPDVKLPDYRTKSHGIVYYTRGRIGQKLHRNKQEFDVSDPLNRRTATVDSEEYSALHDPHCKGYFAKPNVMKHLQNQQLINSKGEVLCNVHEFNQYRSYLGSLFNDQVKRRISDSDGIKLMEKNLGRSICFEERQLQGQKTSALSKQTQTKHQWLNDMYETVVRRRHESKVEKWKSRLEQIDRQRLVAQSIRCGEYARKHWNAFLTRGKADKAEEMRKKNTLGRIAYAEVRNDYVTKYDKFVKHALFERYKADQAAVMIARDNQIDDMEQLVAETLKRVRAEWIKKYDVYIEESRENPKSAYEAKLYNEQRRMYLMRKYFNRWRRRVLMRRVVLDEHHRTVFTVDMTLRPFVANLRRNSTAPDFAAGNPQLRRDLKRVFHSLDDIYEVRPTQRRLFGNRDHGSGDAAGVEVDLDEADKNIDNAVRRYTISNDLLKTKLKRGSSIPKLESRESRTSRSSRANSKAHELDEEQKEKKGTIVLLSDINDVIQLQAQDVKNFKGKRFLK